MATERTGKSPSHQEKNPDSSPVAAGPIPPGTVPELILQVQQRAGNQAVARMLQTGGGQPLPGPLQQYFSAYFGRDLGQVRLHTDPRAASSAQALKARAYTLGQDIVFGPGRYRPAEPSGLRLLAHELVHTLQARQAGFSGTGSFQPGRAHDAGGIPPGHHYGAAETQAHRLAGAALSGMPVSEAVRPAAGLHLEPDNGPSGGETTPPAPPRRPPGRETMADLLVEWAQAGLLDPPFRPPEVGEIPPLPVSQAQAAQAGWPTPYIIAGAAPALAPGPAPVAPTPAPVRPPLRLVPPPAPTPTTPLAPGAAPRAAPLISPLAAGALTFLAIMLYSSPTAPAWMDTLNQITGAPYSSPEEYHWERGLPRPTHDYLRYLNQARRIHPAPDLENDPPPQQLPVPLPQPLRPDEEPPDACVGVDVPRRGGHPGHDAYATRVSQSPSDYLARTPTPPGLAITYDGRTPQTTLVWEVKVGHGWFFNKDYQGLRDRTLARFDAQKNLGLAVAGICGYIHFWAIPDRWVASMLNFRWGGTPPVLPIPER